MKKSTKADAAFIAKIKTLNINTGSDGPKLTLPPAKCHGCGEEFPGGEVLAVGLAEVRIKKVPVKSKGDEESFAA